MKGEKEGTEELTVSSPEQVARILSSKGEKSISVTRSDREEGYKNLIRVTASFHF